MTESATQRPQPHDEHRTGRRIRLDTPDYRLPSALAGLLMKGTVHRGGSVALVPKSEPQR